MKRKIAVPADENGNLDSHFGHSRYFEIFETIDNQIVSQNKLVPPPHEPGVLPKWIVQNEITDVIVGGIGDKAFKILNHFEINVHKGAPKLSSTILVEDLLNQTLELSDNNCNHDHHLHQHNHHHNHNHEHQHEYQNFGPENVD